MDPSQWRGDAARNSLYRLLPRLEKSDEKELVDMPVRMMAHRVALQHPDL